MGDEGESLGRQREEERLQLKASLMNVLTAPSGVHTICRGGRDGNINSSKKKHRRANTACRDTLSRSRWDPLRVVKVSAEGHDCTIERGKESRGTKSDHQREEIGRRWRYRTKVNTFNNKEKI